MAHKQRIIIALGCSLMLCCGCRAEVRDRAYAETMAVHSGSYIQGAVRYGEDSAAAVADTPALLPDALQQASGKSLYTGHLSMLLVSGNPLETLLQLTAEQWLTPDCTVLYSPQNAARLLLSEETDLQALYRQATATGSMPAYDAADILGMQQNGACISAIPCYRDGEFTLALWDAADMYSMLSPEACRGLALFGDAWEQFRFTADDAACTLTKRSIICSVTETEGRLFLTLECRARCNAPSKEAETAAAMYLTAALQETLLHGADLFFWQETAIRDGISWAAQVSAEQWRAALQQAEYQVTVSLG